MRSGLAAAPNYAEATAAESRADFLHKLRIVLKELNETKSWIEQIVANSLFYRDKISAIIAENQELRWIIAASIKTARAVQFEISKFRDLRSGFVQFQNCFPTHFRGRAFPPCNS